MSCGGSAPSGPTGPGKASGPLAPSAISVTSQRALLGGSEFQLLWTGTASSYKLSIGSSQGASDVALIETNGSTQTWLAPRAGTFSATVTAKTDIGESPPSAGLTLVSVDLRDVIEAMLFSEGPLSDTRRVNTIDGVFSIWPDGQRVSILVAPDIAEITRSRIAEFVTQYATITGNAVTGSITVTQNDMQDWGINQVPPSSIAVRLGFCSGLATGCNTGGPPAPGCGCLSANIGRSITSLHTPDADYVKHELGHAYGIGHIRVPAGTRLAPLLMGGNAGEISETEAAAISAIRRSGFGRGGRRSQLVAAGLVNR